MADTVTKLQMTGGDPGKTCSLKYISKNLPAAEIDRSECCSTQFGSMPTPPVVQPAVHSYPSQFQYPGRQDLLNLRNFGISSPNLMFQGYSNISDQRYMLGASNFHGQVVYAIPSIHQFPAHSTIPSVSMQSPSSNMEYHAAIQAQIQSMYAMPSPTFSSPVSGVGMGDYSFRCTAYNEQAQEQSFFLQTQYPVQNEIYFGNQTVGLPSVSGALLPSPQKSLEHVHGYSNCTQNRYKSLASHQTQSSIVRGPPRKPRQSGYAIWIGNLPPHTDLMSLVLHVCKESKGLESLFLISKSNCAFANFKDEEACTAAQLKIHDSRFQTVRLVSRLRKGSGCTNLGANMPSGPSSMTKSTQQTAARTPSPESYSRSENTAGQSGTEVDHKTEKISYSNDRFFVVKSLTVEDLEQSVATGVWATQSHNEQVLNEAFQSSENVFLIFSANKSGEYFGYAKMISPIDEDLAATIEFSPKSQLAEESELPKAIPSPASEFAPKGLIVDDSARGTIFWEVDRDDEGGDDEDSEENESERSNPEDSPLKMWGNPFKIEWISTVRLPFYRTRGMRNPWNSNREVKIARDGTELETSIGRKLIALFHRFPSPSMPSIPRELSLTLVGAYQQMHQF